MARYIRLTDEVKGVLQDEFAKQLDSAKCQDGKFTFTRTLSVVDRKANIIFTPAAWMKMFALIQSFDKEVAWHGLAKRGEDGTDDYYIYDIAVYPQEVTGATVNTDQEAYQDWLLAHPSDIFNNIRMQGHSHVNMCTSPSGTDLEHQGKILAQLDSSSFYIFMIWNKKLEYNIKVYDMEKNILFESSDCTVGILGDNTNLDEFVKSAKTMVKERTCSSGCVGYGGNYGGNYGGHSGWYSGNAKTTETSSNTTDSFGSKEKEKKLEEKPRVPITGFYNEEVCD